MVEVKLYFEGNIYNLTPFVEVSTLTISETADKTMNIGGFTITDVKANQFDGLDMSRPMPRNARVRLNLNGYITDMNVDTDIPSQIGKTDRYKHVVKLISPSKMAMDLSTTGLTVTQPQGDIGLYYRSVSKFDNPMAMLIDDEFDEIDFTTRSNSIDTNVLDGMTLKENQIYKFNLNLKFKNYTQQPSTNPSPIHEVKFIAGAYEQTFEVRVDSNGIWEWLTGGNTASSKNLEFEYNNTGVNNAKIEIRYQDYPSSVVVELYEATLTIYTSNTYTLDQIKLDYVVEKILNNEMNEQQFFLDENSKAILSQFISYQWTLPTSYIWLQITRIADYIKAFPRVYYEDESILSRLMVEMIPFDQLLIEKELPDYAFYQSEATLDDYSASIEVNAENVYSENAFIEEVVTLRADGENAQITTDNLIGATSYRIGQVEWIEVSYPMDITVGSETFVAGTVFRLPNAVIDKRYYDTLSTEADYTLTGRESYNQNNTIYYVEGEKHLRGLSNLGGRPQPNTWDTNTYSRAIYEITLAYLAREEGINPNNIDNGLVSEDNGITLKIRYRPYTETNAVMFKDDQRGFQFHSRKLLNENMAVNDPDIIGSYAQGIANRSGGTKHSYGGTAIPTDVPEVLTTNEDRVLYARTITMLNFEKCSYLLYYIKDYIFISSYESYDQKERIDLVPRDAVIDRVIKKNNYIIFSERELYGNDQNYLEPVSNFFEHLIGGTYYDYAPKLARLKMINDDETIEVLLPITAQAIGRTIEFRVRPKDNYSAGLQKYQSGSNWYQKDFRYTSIFGRVEDIEIDFYPTITFNTAELNALPEAPTISEDAIFHYEYNLRKDAREIPIISAQYTYMSETDNIVVYDDIAKSAYLINRSDIPARDIIKVAVLDYVPSKNAKTVDLTRATINGTITNNQVTDTEGYLEIETDYAKPVVIFDSNTLEILLLDKRELKDRTIYYRGDAVLRKYLGLHYRVHIGIEESFTADLIEPISFSEELTLVVDTFEYYHHDIYKFTLYIPVVETITFDLVSHDISEQITLNAEVEDDEDMLITATPTVGTVTCQSFSGTNYAVATMTNNDSKTVTIYRGGVAIDTLTGGQTKQVRIQSLPAIIIAYNYNYNITAKVSYKYESSIVNKTGTITLCLTL